MSNENSLCIFPNPSKRVDNPLETGTLRRWHGKMSEHPRLACPKLPLMLDESLLGFRLCIYHFEARVEMRAFIPFIGVTLG